MFNQKNCEVFKEGTNDSTKELSELKNEIESGFQVEEGEIKGDEYEYFEKLSQKEELTDEEMRGLIDFETRRTHISLRSINLNNLKKITDKQCEELSKFEGRVLTLNGLNKITDKQAYYLSKFEGTVLQLNGIVEASDKQIKELSKFEGHELGLEGLSEMTIKQISYLSKNGCRRLYISGVKRIPEKQLNLLIKSKRYEYLDLSGLESISESQLEILKNFEGKYLLLNDNSLTDEEKRILRENLGDKLILTGILYNTQGTN